jgi:hypothetical protein
MEGNMNPVLLIFTQIAVAACGYLVYFLYALRRESRTSRNSKVEIRPVPAPTNRDNVLRLPRLEKPKARRVASRR